jgi:hypothetical protein
MSFLGFYFNKPKNIKGKCGFIKIKESDFNNLVENFSKDYKYIVEIEEFKNQWGYGYKYLIEDGYIILLNKFKDETDNDSSLLYFDDENSFSKIQEDYKINVENKQYTKLGDILWD